MVSTIGRKINRIPCLMTEVVGLKIDCHPDQLLQVAKRLAIGPFVFECRCQSWHMPRSAGFGRLQISTDGGSFDPSDRVFHVRIDSYEWSGSKQNTIRLGVDLFAFNAGFLENIVLSVRANDRCLTQSEPFGFCSVTWTHQLANERLGVVGFSGPFPARWLPKTAAVAT